MNLPINSECYTYPKFICIIISIKKRFTVRSIKARPKISVHNVHSVSIFSGACLPMRANNFFYSWP